MENKTLKNLIKEATLGVADSMFLLGRHFYKGDLVKQDYYSQPFASDLISEYSLFKKTIPSKSNI